MYARLPKTQFLKTLKGEDSQQKTIYAKILRVALLPNVILENEYLQKK